MKKTLLLLSLLAILMCGVKAVRFAYDYIPDTYNGSNVDAVALHEHPDEYNNANADGVASIIVNENMEKTMANNVVSAVVFDYRGFDTLGESFILLTAIAGSFVILGGIKSPKKKSGEEVKKDEV